MYQKPNSDKIQAISDEQLIEQATRGDSAALESLLLRHQLWIYNLAFYMLHHRTDAEDVTQEILVKIATNLGSFQRASAFRTWARRIAVNHVLDFRRSRPEQVVTGFGCYEEYLANAADTELTVGKEQLPETQLLVEEARISCVMGMLLCLDRNQRVVFLLGEILETGDVLGAELLELTRENFRQRLSRAREQLGAFMLGRCGLVNPKNSCRCARKTGAFIRDKIVDPEKLVFTKGRLSVISVDAPERCEGIERFLSLAQAEIRELYPFFEAPNVAHRISSLLDTKEFRTLLDLSES
jgi:RNA polymerase sigma factor (sigma-70 family)